MSCGVFGEEEQGCETDLLEVQPNEHLVDGLREEETACLLGTRLLILPQEEILVEEEEQYEGGTRETVDDG